MHDIQLFQKQNEWIVMKLPSIGGFTTLPFIFRMAMNPSHPPNDRTPVHGAGSRTARASSGGHVVLNSGFDTFFNLSDRRLILHHQKLKMVCLKARLNVQHYTLPKTNSKSPLKIGLNAPKGNELVFQASIFRGELLVSGYPQLGEFTRGRQWWCCCRDALCP